MNRGGGKDWIRARTLLLVALPVLGIMLWLLRKSFSGCSPAAHGGSLTALIEASTIYLAVVTVTALCIRGRARQLLLGGELVLAVVLTAWVVPHLSAHCYLRG